MLCLFALCWPLSSTSCQSIARDERRINLLADAKWQYSLDGGKSFTKRPPLIEPETTVHFLARTEFELGETSGIAALELTHGLRRWSETAFSLNGRPIKPPLEGMRYRTTPGIDPALLVRGKNVLTAEVTIKNVSSRRRKAKDIAAVLANRLDALGPEHLKMQTGPILGAFTKDSFTVTCRTNMPAEVALIAWEPAQKTVPDEGPTSTGLLHRFKVYGHDPTEVTYWLTLRARLSDAKDKPKAVKTRRWRIATPRSPDKLRFVAVGDSRSRPSDWAKVAAAIGKAKPDFLILSGDMVAYGRNDWEWDEQFFRPAMELLATVPCYPVIGNHEADAPLYDELFYVPTRTGRGRKWAQWFGHMLLIGIDGQQDWSADSKNAKWLEEVLAGAARAEFIFLVNHYPAWSSARHGRLDEDGRLAERGAREAREVIMPLLTKYNATAMIAGHDHCYERSEPPGGVTHIISAGGGAPRYKKTDNADRQNPHSKVFVSTLHYCLFEIEGGSCTMKALTPAGELLDSLSWKARKIEQATVLKSFTEQK